ncbi:hypothetical protein [Pseudomonas chlororaphis]|uniref:hypothetical protein n=1 Tax=Pseudomonas chlororaphis TaxID=587753 RepID=UPI000F585C83|nr:hypothetical protein [Pseudomonas chlororaphis]QLL10664.1 hypothetical protein H0I86_16475 [Pseudomonas chlororaphis subsp. aurantiaca]UVE42876.1 hypothetical protein KS461_15640 [Pseudomonas chlororaphis]
MSLEIPSALLVEVLAGREKLLQGESGMASMTIDWMSMGFGSLSPITNAAWCLRDPKTAFYPALFQMLS